ncbi:MAG: 50S ribosomal protein L2 [Candidatus Cloacimonadota bacterium]|nr:MAG: 50S ribosomal protein L2 [Candidatus Cloacimonadota bacterium]
MGIKKYRPLLPSLRFKTSVLNKELSKAKPLKSLTSTIRRTGGRNNQGREVVSSRGGGSKRHYRIIDFKRDKYGINAKVKSIEYAPFRSCWLNLLVYVDGEKRYIIAPHELEVGEMVISGPDAAIKVGNALPLRNIPLGTDIHNIQSLPGKEGTVVRSAGCSAQILAKEGKYAHIHLPSGEVKLFLLECYATIGSVSNPEHNSISLGKAGRSRWLGRRPHTRGVAKNPVDHPMGGGEGKSSGGRHPCSPKGLPAKGFKTRKKNKPGSKFIIKRRGKRRGGG